MIRIIKEGSYKRITCETCGAVLAYDEKEDLKMKACAGNPQLLTYVTSTYIECPCCGYDINCGTMKACKPYMTAEEVKKHTVKGE